MEYEIEKVKRLSEGLHEGVVIKVEERNEPYKYLDIVVEFKGNEFPLKKSYPRNFREGSKLVEFLSLFGGAIEVGKKINPEKLLVGKKVKCLIEHKKKGDRTYTDIVNIKPL